MSVSDFAEGDRVEITKGVHKGTTATVVRIGIGSIGLVRDGESSPQSYAPIDLRRLPAATAPSATPIAVSSTAGMIPVGCAVNVGEPGEPIRTGTVSRLDPGCPDGLVYYILMDDTGDHEWFEKAYVTVDPSVSRRLVITVDIPDDETPADYLDTTSSVTALIDYIAEHHDAVRVEVEAHAR